MPRVRLFDYAASANCYKVRLLLSQLGTAHERIALDIFAGHTLTEAFRAVNPARSVPVLEVPPGRFLPESNAILDFLAQGTPFHFGDAFERAEVVRWLIFEQTDVMGTMGGLRFRLLTGRLTPDDPEARRRHAGAVAALELLDAHLADRRFLVGERYSIADIAVYAYAHLAGEAGLNTTAYPRFRRWLGTVEEQPGFVDDLAPYPPNASTLAGLSIYG